MKQINNFGILVSITWSSNKWQDSAEDIDLEHSDFQYIKENWNAYESINFGHKKYPAEEDGTYIAYTPMFNRLPALDTSKNVKVVFFKSNDWHTKENYIVGLYAFPEIESSFVRKAEHPIYKDYQWGNLKSQVDNIVLFKNFLSISNERLTVDQFLPYTKKLGQQGFNYLHSDNVLRILDRVKDINPKQKDFLLVQSRLKKLILFD